MMAGYRLGSCCVSLRCSACLPSIMLRVLVLRDAMQLLPLPPLLLSSYQHLSAYLLECHRDMLAPSWYLFAPCPPALRGVWSGWVSSAHCAWAGPAEPRSLLSLGCGGWPPVRLSIATMGVSHNVAPPGSVGAPSGLALYYCCAWVALVFESVYLFSM